MPRGASSRASERENASWACFDAEYGPTATVPATETMFTTWEPAVEPGQECERRPDRAEVVRAITCSIRSGSRVEKVSASRDARVVDEQVDLRMTLRARAPRQRSTASRSATSHCFVLVGVRWPAREADDAPAARLQRADELGADPGRRAGDDRYLQTAELPAGGGLVARAVDDGRGQVVHALLQARRAARWWCRRRRGRSCRRRSGVPLSLKTTWLTFVVESATTSRPSVFSGAHVRRRLDPRHGRAVDDRQPRLQERGVRDQVVADRVDVLRLLVVGGERRSWASCRA